jgi:hypothetical protein
MKARLQEIAENAYELATLAIVVTEIRVYRHLIDRNAYYAKND